MAFDSLSENESFARSVVAAFCVGLNPTVDEINDIKNQFNKEHRTPLQKSIDRLIDLSTPTMQIDGHGFGDRVKADQFWYVMTDCGEDVSAGEGAGQAPRAGRLREQRCDSRF